MRVRAKKKLFYGNRRYKPGQDFVLQTVKGHKYDDQGKLVPLVLTPEQQFSKDSMERLDPAGPRRGKAAPADGKEDGGQAAS